ncbi:MAG: DNA polymerase III subunit beta [Candidatus Eisenbacteria bacterium]
MKVRLNQEQFSRVLGLVTGVVPPTSAIPVLSNLLFEAEANKVKLSATDLDISVISTLEGEVKGSGSVTIAAKRFQEIVRELAGEEVVIEVDGNKISVTSARSSFRMMGMEKEQFPKIADLEKKDRLNISSGALEKMIRRSIFSVARDDTRPVLSGVLWEMSPEELAMVGTDGHRLARMAIKGDFGIKQEMGVIIPPKALNQILRLLPGDGQVGVVIDNAFVGFFVGDTVVYTRRIEGTFPNYKQVIPKGNANLLVVKRDDLMSATRRVSLLADSKTHKVKMLLAKDSVKLTASTPDLGEAEEEVPATYTGDEMTIGYNAAYIIDAVRNTDSDEIKFELGSPVGASILKPACEPEGESYLCLVMPLRLAEQE